MIASSRLRLRSVATGLAIILLCASCDTSVGPAETSLSTLLSLHSDDPMRGFIDKYPADNVVGVVSVGHLRVAGRGRSYEASLYPQFANQNYSLTVNFGSGWNIVKAGDGLDNTAYRDSILFYSPIALCICCDEVSKKAPLELSWSGSRTAFVAVKLYKEALPNDATVDSSPSFVRYMANSGQFTIDKRDLNALPNGSYKLRVEQFDPKYIELPSNDKLLVLGQSVHEVDIDLVD